MVLSLYPTSYFMATSRLAGSLVTKRTASFNTHKRCTCNLKPDSYRYRTMNGFKGSWIEVSKNLDKLKVFFYIFEGRPWHYEKTAFSFPPDRNKTSVLSIYWLAMRFYNCLYTISFEWIPRLNILFLFLDGVGRPLNQDKFDLERGRATLNDLMLVTLGLIVKNEVSITLPRTW